MAARGSSTLEQVLGAVAGGVGIFLPGLLLVYFVYPVWETLKGIRAIRVSLAGINAVAVGLIAVAGFILLEKGGFAADNLVVTAVTALVLWTRKIPAPLVVLAALAAGVLV
jgi:chromate transporter